MKKLKRISLADLLIFFAKTANAQLDSLIHWVSQEPCVGTIEPRPRFVTKKNKTGLDSIKTYYYYRSAQYLYHCLDSGASNQELLSLIRHKSPIIQSYAAMALSQRDTLLLPDAIRILLANYQKTKIKYGCVVTTRSNVTMLFDGLNERRRETGLPSNRFMIHMDSIFLSHPNTSPFEVGLKLNNLQSSSLNPVIVDLASRYNLYATDYLYKWYRAEHYELLNEAYLHLLDSNNYNHYRLAIIKKLIALDDDKTIRKLGSWLKQNRENWIGIAGIDQVLDRSYIIRDSIGWGDKRYQSKKEDVGFLLGKWEVLNGIKNVFFTDSDTVILKRSRSNLKNNTGIEILHTHQNLSIHIYKNSFQGPVYMVGSAAFDPISNRLCWNTSRWVWYRIIKEEGQLVLIKE